MRRCSVPRPSIVGLAMSGLSMVGLVAAAGVRRRWWREVILQDILGCEGGPTSVATALNEAGVVVGEASARAFRWEDGRLLWLTGYETGSRACAIDDDGAVVGTCFTGSDDLHPTRWGPDGEVAPLPVPAPHAIGEATAIRSGTAVGWCRDRLDGHGRVPWVWYDGGSEALETDGRHGSAAGINRGGMIVGTVVDGSRSSSARVWQPGRPGHDLEGLGGGDARALACDDRGHIVGSATAPDGGEQACLWKGPTAPAIELASIGGSSARAVAVSESGVIVGWSMTPSGFPHACAWQPAGTGEHDRYDVLDLGTLGGQTSEATAINAAGHVVGTASRGRGAVNLPLRPGGWSWEDHAFLTSVDDHQI